MLVDYECVICYVPLFPEASSSLSLALPLLTKKAPITALQTKILLLPLINSQTREDPSSPTPPLPRTSLLLFKFSLQSRLLSVFQLPNSPGKFKSLLPLFNLVVSRCGFCLILSFLAWGFDGSFCWV